MDFELRGCPINKHQLIELISATLAGRKPNIPAYSVCVECKRQGNVCVLVAHGTPCLGPVTHAGCGALCPSYREGAMAAMGRWKRQTRGRSRSEFRILGQTNAEITRAFRGFNAWAWQFRKASEEAERNEHTRDENHSCRYAGAGGRRRIALHQISTATKWLTLS